MEVKCSNASYTRSCNTISPYFADLLRFPVRCRPIFFNKPIKKRFDLCGTNITNC